MFGIVFTIIFILFLLGFGYVLICTLYWSVKFAFYRLSEFSRRHSNSRK